LKICLTQITPSDAIKLASFVHAAFNSGFDVTINLQGDIIDDEFELPMLLDC